MLANILRAAATAAAVAAGWNLANATFNGGSAGEFTIFGVESDPQGLFFKPDGTKMYIVGFTNDRVNEFDLSVAWDISTASYLQNFSVSGEPSDVFFKPDGTKMYTVDEGQRSYVNEYDLSTAWDVSSASYLQQYEVEVTQERDATGLFFKPDGTKMYIVGFSGDDVNEYDLSTAWNISTASYLQNFSVSAQETSPQGLFFKPDGTKMYIVGSAGDDVNEYDLSVAWDISTASYLQNFSVSAQETAPTGVFFKPDGTKMYIVGENSGFVTEYDLSVAWNISTAVKTTYTSDFFSVSGQEISPRGLFFKPDGTKMYIVGTSGDDVNEYDLSVAWNISTASYLQNFSVSAQESIPTGLFFKPDGTKMYIVGTSGDDVNEYDLSVAWDISTASYLQNFSVSAQEISPQGLFFKPDGTKMYIVGTSGDDVNEYDLSTAWNISTASYLQNFSVSAQESRPTGLFFKPDGTKMYIVGFSGDDVNEYDLSVAWDISTASYLQNFSVSAQETVPEGLFFKPDGFKMYIVGFLSESVLSYDL